MTSFPPQDIRDFLTCCAGEWLALRSRFAFDADEAANGEDTLLQEGEGGESWHDSERTQLRVTYLEPRLEGEPGGLAISAPSNGTARPVRRELIFSAGGRFHSPSSSADDHGEGEGQQEGSWTLRPDGSLVLTVRAGAVMLKERIWFPKPNLRLRSSVEQRDDGRPGRARFSSEIRRVTPPQEPTPAPSA